MQLFQSDRQNDHTHRQTDRHIDRLTTDTCAMWIYMKVYTLCPEKSNPLDNVQQKRQM